jgi:hypothetical protein
MFMCVFHSAFDLFSSQGNKILQFNAGGIPTEQLVVDKKADSSDSL